MNIQNIKNSTISKLTANEVGELGLVNYGVGLYKGDLKSRVNGLKTVKVSENEIWFCGTSSRIEFIKLASVNPVDGRQEWAARIWRESILRDSVFQNEDGKYEEYPMGITGCRFFR